MKKDTFYFKNLYDCVECSYRAAQFLEETVREFDKKTYRTK